MNEVVECVDLQDLYMPVDLLEVSDLEASTSKVEYVDSEEEEDASIEAG